ncbi:unnamed protein product [Soboliphyme baturini]|uniref:Uncharacterized protein n=1 Tax=Soboliphyme baturini TaxID=241478 RepID=A0A183ISI6_9BILA|nr:unnamed protein product [Soboliphyme baturini]
MQHRVVRRKIMAVRYGLSGPRKSVTSPGAYLTISQIELLAADGDCGANRSDPIAVVCLLVMSATSFLQNDRFCLSERFKARQSRLTISVVTEVTIS